MEKSWWAVSLSILLVAVYIQLRPQDSDKDLSLGDHVSAQRAAYIAAKSQIDKRVLQDLQDLEIPPAGQSLPKVAFLFLTKQKIQTLKEWKAFFQDAPTGRYSIYVHASTTTEKPTEASVYQPLAEYGARLLPFFNGTWCALTGLTTSAIQMMLQDPNNVQLVVVSETCVPLKSFKRVYHELVELSPKTSKVCLAQEAMHRKMGQHYNFDGSTGCVFRDFYSRYDARVRKIHQWIVLSREHAAAFVRRSLQSLDRYHNVWRVAAPDWSHAGEGCSCEAVPLLAVVEDLHALGHSTGDYWKDLELLGVEQRCLTFVHWFGCFIGHKLNRDNPWRFFRKMWELPLLFPVYVQQYLSGQDIDFLGSPLHQSANAFPYSFRNVELEYLKDLVGESFLFARKFEENVQVVLADGTRQPLVSVLPVLWRHVDEADTSAPVWSRMQNPDLPPPYNHCGRVHLSAILLFMLLFALTWLSVLPRIRLVVFILFLAVCFRLIFGLVWQSGGIN